MQSFILVLLLASGTLVTSWQGTTGYNADPDLEMEEAVQVRGSDNDDDDSDGTMLKAYGDDDDDDDGVDDQDYHDNDDSNTMGYDSDDDDDSALVKALEMYAAFTGHEGKKIKFDYSTNVDEEPVAYSSDEEPEENSHQQLESMRWVAVTAAGYEYEGDLDEAKELMAKVMAEKEKEGVKLGNEDDGDVPENGNTRQRRSVFGRDNRQLVRNTGVYPYSAMGRVDTGCTGTFISSRHVLTAAHCVFNRKTRRWYNNLNFRRGKNCDPHGGRRHYWKYVVAVKGYTHRGLAAYDYALITYRTPSTTWMSYGYTRRRRLRSGTLTIAGYPADKPKRCLWKSRCSARRISFWGTQFYHRCDTAQGMSGSGVFKYNRRYRRHVIYGIHAYGGNRYNSATRITRSRFRQLGRWIKKYT